VFINRIKSLFDLRNSRMAKLYQRVGCGAILFIFRACPYAIENAMSDDRADPTGMSGT
jgi:hypothetical protein